MGLFEKKFCDICGQKIGLLGNNKVVDGNVCDKCRGQLSPFFKSMSKSNLQQVREQLSYRENNRQQLNQFKPDQVLGYSTKVYVDHAHNCFVVSKKSDYRAENADIINLSSVLGVTSETKEHKKELYQKDSEGHNQPYNPRRYQYSYEIIVTINVNNPYFTKIEFEVTKDRPENKTSPEFVKYQNEANQIIAVLTGRQQAAVQGGMGGISNAVGGIGQAVAGVAGLAGIAGIAGALLGNQNANQQQGMMNNQPYGQQGMMNNQSYGQQGMMNNQPYGQQGMTNNQPYGQQGMMNNQPYGQQGMMNNQQYGQQGMMNNQGFAQQGFGGQWVCPNCGTTNNGNFCQSCGTQKQF